VERLLAGVSVPIILDADAINVCHNRVSLLKRSRGEVVITPHPGEMARLMNCRTQEVQADRRGVAERAASVTQSVVLLKGAGSLVAQRGRRTQINLTGNPGMATGGVGDVLGGMLVSLAAQGLGVFDAARAAAYVHGRAGDRVARRTSQLGTRAGAILEEIPAAFREIMPR
jgi:NAD(P)H-hydrate epimerase